MTPYKHAQSTAHKFGGCPEDYIEVHDWLDCTKQYTGDYTHRALRHHAAGVQWAIAQFGHSIMNSTGVFVPMKSIVEQHIIEDCGFIPMVSDWLSPIKKNPAAWMLRVKTNKTNELTLQEDEEGGKFIPYPFIKATEGEQE